MRNFSMDEPRLASRLFLKPDFDDPRVASANIGEPIVSAKPHRERPHLPMAQDRTMVTIVNRNRPCLDENDDFHPAEWIQFALAAGL